MICKKCKIEKPETDFYFRDKKLNIKRLDCKVCCEQNRKNKEHYEKYKDEYKVRREARKKRLINENRNFLCQYLEKRFCVDCGENDKVVLQFDHLIREDKKYYISRMMYDFTWEQILEEINKCEVVCGNCHLRRTAKQFGWYKLYN